METTCVMQAQTDLGPFHKELDVVVPPFAIEKVKERLKSLPREVSLLEKQLARDKEIAYKMLEAESLVSATEAKKLFAEARAINEEYVKLGHKAAASFKEKIQEAQPHLLKVNDFFAHKKKNELFDGHETAESWYLNELGCTASYARRCLKPRTTHGLFPSEIKGREGERNKKPLNDATKDFDDNYDSKELVSSSAVVLTPREDRVKRIMRFIAEAVSHLTDDEKTTVYLDVSVLCKNAHDGLVGEDGGAE